MHLTHGTLARLLDGTLDATEARALAEHLSRACEECEGLLASRVRADPVDGRVDQALAALAEVPVSGAGSDLEYARIQRALRGGRPARRLAPLAALAAVALAVGVVALKVGLDRTRPGRDAWDGVKGLAAQAVPLRLRFLVVLPGEAGGPPRLEKGASGAAVPARAGLQFQVEAGRQAHAALVRVSSSGEGEVFWHGAVAPGAPLEVTVGGRPAAYPLEGLAGPQRFVLLGGPEALAPDRIAAAARALAPPGRASPDRPDLAGLSFDVVEVTVR
jgi:hypothetical protein